ncbi:MAG: RNA polymerase sigma-70 factor, partial [Bacteroidales bacterium]|nr:RNA polymerase sigma-70 factor [Bacteroidales bacterium]
MKTRPDIDELFRLYYRPLCMYGARFLGDADAVEDVVQAAFVSLWERLQAGGQVDQPKSY